MACDTRINASYRSDSRCSDGASESEVMRMLGAATIIPLSLLMPHCLAAMQKPDIFFQVALLEPAASMFYPTDLKRHNERNVTSIRRLPACRHCCVGVFENFRRSRSTTRMRAVPRGGRSLAGWRGTVCQVECPPRRLPFSRARTAGACSCSRDRVPEPSA